MVSEINIGPSEQLYSAQMIGEKSMCSRRHQMWAYQHINILHPVCVYRIA